APDAGADYVNTFLSALTANPQVWQKSVFILTYDEDGGFFDHVLPPTAPPGTPDEFVDGLPIGLGGRVPPLLSPRLPRGVRAAAGCEGRCRIAPPRWPSWSGGPAYRSPTSALGGGPSVAT